MEHWLRLLPEERIQGSPCLLVARAWLLQAHGQLKDLPPLLTYLPGCSEKSDSSVSDPDDPSARLLQALIAILWSQIQYFTGQVQASIESASAALEMLQPGDEYIASFALMFQAWSHQSMGKEDTALAILNNALRERSTHPNVTARLLLARALCFWLQVNYTREHFRSHLLQIAQGANVTLKSKFCSLVPGIVVFVRSEMSWMQQSITFSAVIANQHHAHFWWCRMHCVAWP